jgi:hypothetical protein
MRMIKFQTSAKSLTDDGALIEDILLIKAPAIYLYAVVTFYFLTDIFLLVVCIFGLNREDIQYTPLLFCLLILFIFLTVFQYIMAKSTAMLPNYKIIVRNRITYLILSVFTANIFLLILTFVSLLGNNGYKQLK